MTSCIGPECGDGSIDNGEDCDDDRLAPVYSKSCGYYGYNGGDLVNCSSSCRLDLSQCEASGKCGDGVITTGFEDCEGSNLDGNTCESIGHHAGELKCAEDCTWDLSSCLMCGDGVVQEEFGELYEPGYFGCELAGFFGGYMLTEDCVNADFSGCGNYRFIMQEEGVSVPSVLVDGQDKVWISGLARGAFNGHSNLDKCPELLELQVWSADNCSSWQELKGYYYNPLCDQEFIGLVEQGKPLAVLSQNERSEESHLKWVDLGDVGVGEIRQSPNAISLSVMNSQGLHTNAFILADQWNGYDRFVTQSVDGSKIGYSFFSDDGFEVGIIDPISQTYVKEENLVGIEYDNKIYEFRDDYGYLLEWQSSESIDLVVWLLTQSGEGEMGYYFVSLDLTTSPPGVARFFPLEINADWELHTLAVVEVNQTVEISHSISQQIMVLSRYTLGGTKLEGWEINLSDYYKVESILRTPSGYYAISGISTDWEAEVPEQPQCMAATGKIFTLWYDKVGNQLKTDYFATEGSLNSYYLDVCNTSYRTWSVNDNYLVMGGTYVMDRPLCFSEEPTPTYNDLPLYTCEAYLVRFETP
jgi:hypothetical protein